MPLSVSLGWTHYETEHWRYAWVSQATDEIIYSGSEVAWVPGQRNASPYVSLGLGLVERLDDHLEDDTLGGALKVEAGFELLRHSNVRALVGANVILPFQDRGNAVNIGLHLRMCF
jgi:hypothetical protein